MEKNIHTFVVLAYKESPYLEDCIKSVLNQSVKSKVVIATSTPNSFITQMADKYKLNVITNPVRKGIGYDFDFAVNCGNTELVTVAHQDDIYDYTYAEKVIKAYKKQKKSTIIFTNYYEIKKKGKVYFNINLLIKRFLLFPLKFHFLARFKFVKRNALRFGCSICCPAVTFCKKNVSDNIFSCDLKCNIDWFAWEKLSKKDGYFYYINKSLMGHRIYSGSTTSEIINDNKRTNEDYIIFSKFWPKWIARIISNVYSLSEKSNNK